LLGLFLISGQLRQATRLPLFRQVYHTIKQPTFLEGGAMYDLARRIISIAAQLAASALPLASSAHAASPVTVADTRVFPESISVTSDGTLLIAGSEKGIIYKATPGAATAQAWISREQAGFEGFLLGIYADEPHGVFYVCSDVAGPPRKAAFTAFDLKTGVKKATYAFPDGGLCNDFITAADGTVYATDTVLGRIIRLRPGATEPDVWASDPAMVGIDGIAFAGGKLYFNNVRKNLLQRIEINADGSAGAITTLQLSAEISGPDGMRVGPGNVLLITENKTGKLTEAKLDGDKATLSIVKDGFGQLTAIGVVGDMAWVAESKFALRDDPNNKDPGPWLIMPVSLH
jgi:sugar lactone lactonase YvrE